MACKYGIDWRGWVFKGGLRMIWSLFMFVRVGIILLGLCFFRPMLVFGLIVVLGWGSEGCVSQLCLALHRKRGLLMRTI